MTETRQAVKRAVAVIMTRGDKDSLQVYLIQRAHSMRFMGGYWAFPGGNVGPIDRREDDPLPARALARCAVRELFEETGVMASTLGPSYLEPAALPERSIARDDPEAWHALLADAGAPEALFSPVCAITTPEFAPVRFETDFIHLPLHPDEQPRVDGQECIDGAFVDPASTVAAWERGEILVAPPVLFLLRILARTGLAAFPEAARRAAEALEDGGLHPVTFTPGVFVAPLRTPTLPPATTTNTIIAGQDRLYVFDPGTPEDTEFARLTRELDRRVAEGASLEAICLTHHHRDHVGSLERLSRHYGLPVRAHELAYERVPGDYIRGEPLAGGDVLELGTAPDGSSDWRLDVLHTPGHAVDHLCFIDSRYGAAIVGDMCSTISTILIEPPEGHLRTYLESLRRLLDTPMTTLYPAHGLPDNKGKALVRQYLAHRAERESALLAALGDAPRTPEEIVPDIYTDVPEKAWPLAARSLLAGLIKLEEEGRARRREDGWVAAAA